MSAQEAPAPPRTDTTWEAERIRLEILRAMAPGDRLRMGLELTELSRRLLLDGIRARHPEYGPDEARLAALRAWLGPDVFRLAYPSEPELSP